MRKLNVKYKWKHLPQRSDRGQHRKLPIAPRPPSLTVLSRRATAEGLQLQRAAAPALPSDPLPSLEIRENASRAHSAVEDLNVDVLAARLAAGRTVTNLASVMDARLFATWGSAAQPALRPSRGLFALLNGEEVFIVGTFTSYRVPMADVIPLRVRRDSALFFARLKDTRTCPQRDLCNVGVRYHLAANTSRTSTVLTFKKA